MIRLFISVAVFIAVAGCASSAPQATASGATATNTASGVVANVDSGSDDVVDVIEVPTVAKTAVVDKGDEMVCHRERMTGSHRFEKICRTRAEIEETRRSTSKALRDAGSRTGVSQTSE